MEVILYNTSQGCVERFSFTRTAWGLPLRTQGRRFSSRDALPCVGRVTVGRRGSSRLSAGRRGGRLGKDRSGRSYGTQHRVLLQGHAECRHGAKPAERACTTVRRVLGAQRHRPRSVKAPRRAIGKRQPTRSGKSEVRGPESRGRG